MAQSRAGKGRFVAPFSDAQSKYHRYLESWRWRWLIRPIRLRIDGYKCRLCCKTEGLELHHSRYDNLGGDLLLEVLDVITLCGRCHGLFHGKD